MKINLTILVKLSGVIFFLFFQLQCSQTSNPNNTKFLLAGPSEKVWYRLKKENDGFVPMNSAMVLSENGDYNWYVFKSNNPDSLFKEPPSDVFYAPQWVLLSDSLIELGGGKAVIHKLTPHSLFIQMEKESLFFENQIPVVSYQERMENQHLLQ